MTETMSVLYKLYGSLVLGGSEVSAYFSLSFSLVDAVLSMKGVTIKRNKRKSATASLSSALASL